MGGSDGGIIIRNLKTAATLSLNPSGSFKVWHLLAITHAIAALGWLF